jgi:hypothetical protein
MIGRMLKVRLQIDGPDSEFGESIEQGLLGGIGVFFVPVPERSFCRIQCLVDDIGRD